MLFLSVCLNQTAASSNAGGGVFVNTVVELKRTSASSDGPNAYLCVCVCERACVCVCVSTETWLKAAVRRYFLYMELPFSVSFSGCFLSGAIAPIDREAMALTASLSESRLSLRLWACR